MTNSINGAGHGLSVYRPSSAQQNEAPSKTQASAPEENVKVSDLAARARANGIEKAEQQMVEQYFPTSEKMSLRLYGPDSDARDVSPGAVGSRLDIRG